MRVLLSCAFWIGFVSAMALNITPSAHAIQFVSPGYAARGEVMFPVALSPIEVLGVTAALRQGVPNLYVQQYLRGETGSFAFKGNKQIFPFSDLLSVSEGQAFAVRGVEPFSGGIDVLIEQCSDAVCDYHLLRLSGADLAPSKLPVVFPATCPDIALLANKTIMACQSIYTYTDQDIAEVLSGSSFFHDAVTLNEQRVAISATAQEARLHYRDKSLIIVSEPAAMDLQCALTSKDVVYYHCLSRIEVNEKTLRYNVFTGHIEPVYGEPVVNLPKVWETTFDQSFEAMSLVVDQEHFFVKISGSTKVVYENWSLAGERFTSRQFDTKERLAYAGLSRDPMNYLLLSAHRGATGQDVIAIYDNLAGASLPQLKQGIIPATRSTLEYRTDIVAQDENTLPGDIQVSFEGLPAFLQWDPVARQLSGTPANTDVGTYEFVLTLTGQPEQTRDHSLSLEVLLIPYEIRVYEPTLFERWKIDEPAWLDGLLKAAPTWPTLEDDEINLTFTRHNRSESELSFTPAEDTPLPAWLRWDPQQYKLSGTPEQKNVGVHNVTLIATDVFDAATPKRYDLQINVVEVDEPFRVLSNGQATLSVGDNYSYQLVTEDEETPPAEMTINAAFHPKWLTWDSELRQLSGTVPSTQEAGDVLVQFLIWDEAGHSMIHQFSLTIESNADTESSAGSFPKHAMLLLLLIGLRRKLKSTDGKTMSPASL